MHIDPNQQLPEGKTCGDCCRVMQCFCYGLIKSPFDAVECAFVGGSAFVLRPKHSPKLQPAKPPSQ